MTARFVPAGAPPLLPPDLLARLESGARRSAPPPAARPRPRRRSSGGSSPLDALFHALFAPPAPSLCLLLDAGPTMTFASAGQVPKFVYARRFAAAVGYVGLVRGGHVGAQAVGNAHRVRVSALAPLSGSPLGPPALFGYLQRVVPGSRLDHRFAAALRSFACRRAGDRAACLVLSDFFDPHWRDGLRALLTATPGLAYTFVHILDPGDVAPAPPNLRWVDPRSGGERPMSFPPDEAGDGWPGRCRAALDDHCRDLAELARGHGMGYLRLTTDTPFEEQLLESLGRPG